MEFPERPTRAVIDLQALRHNLARLRAFGEPDQEVLAVVKADAYGHGALPVSQELIGQGVNFLGVATLEEGMELRKGGVAVPILVFGGCYPGQEETFLEQKLVPALLSLADLQRLDSCGTRLGKRFPVHLKCDTGMGRVGFLPSEIPTLLETLSQARALEIQGLMSHLACADELGSLSTQEQIACFGSILAQFRAAGIHPQYVHLGNSAGLVGWDLPGCNLARPGIALYGGAPLNEQNAELGLQPVMSLVTQIAQLRTLEAGSGVSYGHIHHTQRRTRLATLPIGYADGYNRLLSNCAEVLVRGQRAPVVGRVCMDWIMVDVTDIPGVEVGDQVVLLGRDGDAEVSSAEWAEKLRTIDYEIFCRIGQRVPRHYVNATAG